MSKPHEEDARLFEAAVGPVGNAASEVYPGCPGLVVAGGELRSMVWGFPLVLKGKNGQPLKPKPVNNARADKLDSFLWRYSFAERCCLIPMTELADAMGSAIDVIVRDLATGVEVVVDLATLPPATRLEKVKAHARDTGKRAQLIVR